jgi:hypothetical protein
MVTMLEQHLLLMVVDHHMVTVLEQQLLLIVVARHMVTMLEQHLLLMVVALHMAMLLEQHLLVMVVDHHMITTGILLEKHLLVMVVHRMLIVVTFQKQHQTVIPTLMVVDHHMATLVDLLDQHLMVTAVVIVVHHTVTVVAMVNLTELNHPVHPMVSNQQANIAAIIRKNLTYPNADLHRLKIHVHPLVHNIIHYLALQVVTFNALLNVCMSNHVLTILFGIHV